MSHFEISVGATLSLVLLNKHLICFRMTKPVSRSVINEFNYELELCISMEKYAMALNGFREIGPKSINKIEM